MKDPKRLFDDSSSFEAQLLRSWKENEPTPGVRMKTLAMVTVSTTTAVAAATSAAATSAASASAAAKAASVLSGATAAGGAMASTSAASGAATATKTIAGISVVAAAKWMGAGAIAIGVTAASSGAITSKADRDAKSRVVLAKPTFVEGAGQSATGQPSSFGAPMTEFVDAPVAKENPPPEASAIEPPKALTPLSRSDAWRTRESPAKKSSSIEAIAKPNPVANDPPKQNLPEAKEQANSSASAPLGVQQGRSPELAVQVRLLDDARRALHAGRLQDSLNSALAYERSFPNGPLAQEAALIRIETYFARGDRAGATQAVQIFSARYPGSAHGAKLRRRLESGASNETR